MIKVLIDTSPLGNASAIRGIGVYTSLLTEYLSKRQDVEVFRSTDPGLADEVKFDIIHYPYFDLFFSTLPLLRRTKRVVTVHDVIPLKFAGHYPAGIKGGLLYQKQKISLKNTNGVITDSLASKADIEEQLGLDPAKIHAVYLAGNPNIKRSLPRDIAAIRKKYHLPAEYCLYVGDINYNKNLPQLIKALKYLPEKVKLVMVGKAFMPQEIPEWQWIDTQLEMSNVRSRVMMLPEITGDATHELSAIYSGARVYVQPSLYEGFGLPVLEAMQSCVPVVCAQNSSLVEVGGQRAVFCQTDAESIAEQLNQVLGWSQAKRTKHTQAGLAWSKEFSWEKTAQQTVSVYKQILGTR